MRKEMKSIVDAAKKRRAKYLAAFEKSGMTIVKFASKHGMTGERMGQLLKKARSD